MAITDLRVSEATLNQQGVVAAPDVLTGSARENKEIFDRLVRSVVTGALNPLIDLLASGAGAAELGAVFAGLASPTVQAALDELARRVER